MNIKVEAKDKKVAKILEEMINAEYPKHKEFIEALFSARMYILGVYGLETDQKIWDRIADAYMKKVIELDNDTKKTG